MPDAAYLLQGLLPDAPIDVLAQSDVRYSRICPFLGSRHELKHLTNANGGAFVAKSEATHLRTLFEWLDAHVLLDFNDARDHFARLDKHWLALRALT